MYDLYVTLTNGDTIRRTHNIKEIGGVLDGFMFWPAAIGGLIKEIKIVDSLDCTNFLWQKGEGIIFPAREQMDALLDDLRALGFEASAEEGDILKVLVQALIDGIAEYRPWMDSSSTALSPPRLPTSPSMLDLARELEVELQEHRGGFRYICKNGNTVSVQWGEGNRCKNDDRDVVTEWVPDVKGGGFCRYPEGYDCEDAEIAIINKEGKWHWFGHDTAFASQSPDEVRTWIQWAEENEITPKPNRYSRSGWGHRQHQNRRWRMPSARCS